MEFEIDEFALDAWTLGDCEVTDPNHAPPWCSDPGSERLSERDAEGAIRQFEPA